MISQVIESGLKGLSPSVVTDIFIVVILGLFLLSLYWGKQGTHHKFTGYSPTLLTSIGILGTFTGIVIGLLEFNTVDIDGSITSLLEGLKVAFVTSLLGILASILLKILATVGVSKSSTEAREQEVGIEDLYNIMSQQNDNLIKLNNKLSDNDDSSLIGQIKLMRSDASDNHRTLSKSLEPLQMLTEINTNTKRSDQTLFEIKALMLQQHESFDSFKDSLWIKLQDFADMLSKSATEQVINALKEVVQDFNNKLGEQFAENFEKLHLAVENLVLWQNEYKVQLGQMKEQFDTSVTAMSDMEKSVESISTHSKAIPESMADLKTVITTNQHQVDELSSHLEAFKDVRDRAVEAVPEIKNQIETTIKGFQEASGELMTGISSSTDKVSQVLGQNAEDFSANVAQTNQALVDSSDTLKVTSTEMREMLDATLLDMNKHVKKMVEDLSLNSKEVSAGLKDVGSVLMQELGETHKEVQTGIATTMGAMQHNMDTMNNEQSKYMKEVGAGLKDVGSVLMQELGETHKEVQTGIATTMGEMQHNMDTMNNEQSKYMKEVGEGLKDVGSVLMQELGDTHKEVQTKIATTMGEMQQNIDNMSAEQTKHMKTVLENIDSTHQQVQNNIAKITGDLEHNIDNLSKEQVKQLNKVFDSVEHTINQSLQKTGESIQTQVTLMDEIAGKEIENVMNAMGTSLTTITHTFTNDYQKLVQEMKKIVESRG